jgi:hypothetical protein
MYAIRCAIAVHPSRLRSVPTSLAKPVDAERGAHLCALRAGAQIARATRS